MQPVPVPMSRKRNSSRALVGRPEMMREARSDTQCSVSGRGMRVGGRTTSGCIRGWNGWVPAVAAFESVSSVSTLQEHNKGAPRT